MKLLKKVQIFNTGFTMHQELTMQKKIFHLVFDIITFKIISNLTTQLR